MPFVSIGQLRSSSVQDLGHGNMSTFKKAALIAARAGIKGLCVLPINETPPNMASPFSRASFNALSLRLVDPLEIPEIKEEMSLSNDVARLIKQDIGYSAEQAKGKMDIPFAEAEARAYLRSAYTDFDGSKRQAARGEAFLEFTDSQRWWLEPYAYFKTLSHLFSVQSPESIDPKYTDIKSEEARKIMSAAKELMGYHCFAQFEAERQVREAFAYAHEAGIEEIEILMGIGVSRESAEGLLMRDIFDPSRQIGCMPEPENGYPVQLWGLLAERNEAPGLLDFKAASMKRFKDLGADRISLDHAAGLLGGFATFPVYGEIGGEKVMLDAKEEAHAQYAVWNGQWDIEPGNEQRRAEHANITLSSILERTNGLKLSAETVGDGPRRTAAEQSIIKAIENGHDITLMRALPWEDMPLSGYGPADRLSVTHDMPVLTGLLCGRAGDHHYKWIDGPFVRRILNKFGILAPQVNRPLQENELSTEFMHEIMKRISCGTDAGTVVLPFSSLFNLLPEYLDAGKWQYTNIQPGTTGEAGNEMGNWEYRLPPVEELEKAAEGIASIAERAMVRLNAPQDKHPASSDGNFACQTAAVRAGSIVYQAKEGNWTVWRPAAGEIPIFEFAAAYLGPEISVGIEGKAWANYSMQDMGIKEGMLYTFMDLVSGSLFIRQGAQLLLQGLSVGLNTQNNRHHFVVLQNRN